MGIQSYHDNTEHSYVFTFENMVARFPEMSGEEIQKFAARGILENFEISLAVLVPLQVMLLPIRTL